MKIYNTIIVFILPILIWASVVSKVFSGDYEGYSYIDADVKIGVCGDGVVEGDEDCEPLVAITQSCADIGYDLGTLTCDSSCEYITNNCSYKPPKPILPPFPNVFDNEPEPEPERPPVFITIPFYLEIYDIDGDGKLNTVEYCDGLTYWVKKWRIRLIDSQKEGDIDQISKMKDTCDLNYDKSCNLVDFSIFLHNAE